jgi:hypothetical protein
VTTQNELDQIRAIVANTLDALGVEPEPDPSAPPLCASSHAAPA